MPAPSMIVTFLDADGDEFPVRVPGWWTRAERPKLLKAARAELDRLVEEGQWRPTMPLKDGVKVELV